MRNARAFSYFAIMAATSFLLPTSAVGEKPEPATDSAGPALTAYSNGVRTEAAKREMTVSSLQIAVAVRGDIAETTVTASFANPTGELLEGQFALNMARGAVVTGYALDINGVLVDGVLETKYKAAEAYQRRVTQRIDPGLAEVDYSDRFETRIYPIQPRGQRTIRLRMVSAFDPAEGYVLPLTLPAKAKRVSLMVTGDARIAALPEGLSGKGETIEAENVQLKGALKLAPERRESAMLVSEHPGAELFFDIVAPAPAPREAKNLPVHVFWDRSVSRTDDKLKDEAQLAEDLVVGRGLRRVKLTLFDSGSVETREVDTARLAEQLAEVRYRGGTSYATLSATPVAAGSDCLMFSDGRVTIDDRRNFSLPCRTFAVASGPETDRAWLGEIAERSGGVAANLDATKRADVLAQLEKPQAGILSVTDAAGQRIETVRLAAPRGLFHIVGPAPDRGAVLVSIAGETAPRRFAVPERGTPVFAGPGALWARHRLGVVAADLPPDELAKMARRYNVATPQASFVVLETPNDYVLSDIEPPETYPKALRQQYISLRRAADDAEESTRSRRLDLVAGLWENQKDWWSTKFDGRTAKQTAKSAATAALDGSAPAVLLPETSVANLATPAPLPAPAPRLMPAAPPAAAGASRDRADDSRDRVVVTGTRRQSAAEDAPRPVEVFASQELRDQGAPSTTEFVRSLALADSDAEAEPDASGRAGRIEIAEWRADRPYLKRLDGAGSNWEDAIDREMAEHGALPLFWFDIAEWHWRAGRKEEARRAAEAALDLPTRDNQTLAIVAARLLRYGSHDRAIWLLERLAEREADRPQPLRTLALALIERSKAQRSKELAKADLARAVELLAKTATGVFDVDAEGVEEVALMEANATLARLKAMGGASNALDQRLTALLEADVRVVMEWNTPRTDLDLWITEPNGEKVGYSDRRYLPGAASSRAMSPTDTDPRSM